MPGDLLGTKVKRSNNREISQKCDVIVTATYSGRENPPVIRDECVSPGIHINAIGADDPGKGELDSKLLRRAKVVPDFWKQARLAGDCQGLPGSEIHAELGEIITGKKRGRESDDEITIFDSAGTAFEEFMVFRKVIELAEELGIGERGEFIGLPACAQNPYTIPSLVHQ
jgi:ornithine cyclodeaminase/alanine dehydrogenase-like protein (mu-crystallin family)